MRSHSLPLLPKQRILFNRYCTNLRFIIFAKRGNIQSFSLCSSPRRIDKFLFNHIFGKWHHLPQEISFNFFLIRSKETQLQEKGLKCSHIHLFCIKKWRQFKRTKKFQWQRFTLFKLYQIVKGSIEFIYVNLRDKSFDLRDFVPLYG